MDIEKLKVRCDVAESCLPNSEYRTQLRKLHREMIAELESARVDAERYRWIKDHSITDRGFCDWKLPDIEYQKDFDAAIDAARGGK